MNKITIKKFQKLSLLLLFLIGYLGLGTVNAQIGIGTTSPDASAQLELQSTAKGFLPPRMDTDARDGIGSPAEGLTIYNTDNKCLEVFDSADWISICDGSVVTSPPPPPSTVTGANGKEWMDRNLGASQVAMNSNDPASYGDFYQWGRAADGHQIRTSNTTSTNATTAVPNVDNSWDGLFITEGNSPYDWLTSQEDNLWQGVNGTNNPCPTGFRLPTVTEWDVEISSWSNAASAFASSLKLPVAGYRVRSNGGLNDAGSTGSYWSSSVSGSSAKHLYFSSSDANMYDGTRAQGYSIRCLKD